MGLSTYPAAVHARVCACTCAHTCARGQLARERQTTEPEVKQTAERVFSLLKNAFGEQQQSSLHDLVTATLMVRDIFLS